MKRISIYLITLFTAVAFTACNEDFDDWADPQNNPQEDPVTITFQATNAASGVFDLNNISSELIDIVNKTLNNAEGTTTAFELQLSKDADFAEKVNCDLSAEGDVLKIAAADLQKAVTDLFGRRPDARKIYIRVNGYVSTAEGQTSLARSNNLEVTVTPKAPNIEAAYYLIGAPNGWSMDNLDNYQFKHSGKDVYEDPLFTLVVELAENDNFKIAPQSAYDSKEWTTVLGNTTADNSTDAEGALATDGNGAKGAMKVAEKGLYRITLDMLEYTYKVERLASGMPESAYYMIGTINGWNGDDVSTLVAFSHSGKDVVEDPNFTLLFESPGNCYWKVIPQSIVDAVKAGEASTVWIDGVLGTAIGDDPSPTGNLAVRAGEYDPGAMLIEEPGWVKVTLNMMEYTYSVEVIGEMALALYVPGGYQGWSPETAPTLYSQGFDMKYDGYVNIAGDGWDQGFKFVNGPDWPNGENGYKDYGTEDEGANGNLMGGSNVTVTEEGFYRLQVDLSGSEYTYSATKTEWGIIGDATPNGWEASTAMMLNASTNEWTITTALTVGAIKFRANNEWDINLGGDLENLSYGGDNISVTEAGTYVITLKLGDPTAYKATMVKQ